MGKTGPVSVEGDACFATYLTISPTLAQLRGPDGSAEQPPGQGCGKLPGSFKTAQRPPMLWQLTAALRPRLTAKYELCGGSPRLTGSVIAQDDSCVLCAAMLRIWCSFHASLFV